MMRNRLGMSLVTSLALGAGLGNVSCAKLECGEGTVERDGTCLPADEQLGDAKCTPGTVLGPLGCEVETPTQCDPDSTEEVFDPGTGLTTCVGTVSGGCAAEIRGCNAPDAGKATLCGRIWDAETDMPIDEAPNAQGAACNPAAPAASGPCSLEVKFYDALDFAGDPTGAMPLAVPGGAVLDDCGRYKGVNFPRATFGFIGIGVDDAMTAADTHRQTGVATPNGSAAPGVGFRAYTTTNTTDTLWSGVLGGGQTFAQRGVLAIIFRYHDAPVEGVQVRKNGTTIPNDDYYFTDTDIQRKTVSMTQGVTGKNGSVLVVNSPTPIAHDGINMEPAGCVWPSSLAASIPGVVFVQIKEAVTPGGVLCQ